MRESEGAVEGREWRGEGGGSGMGSEAHPGGRGRRGGVVWT